MKEPEISHFDLLTPRSSRGPRYRYYSNPPTTVSLRLADLVPHIPEAARLPDFNGNHRIELSCEEIFAGPVPKLPLSRLAEIAREHIQIDGVPDTPVHLPVARLALAYRFVHGRELIEEPPPPEPVKVEKAPEEFVAKTGPSEAGLSSLEAASKTSSDSDPQAALVDDAVSPEQTMASQAGHESGAAEETKSETWRPITVFPILRRKVNEPQVKPPVAPLRPTVETRPSHPLFESAEAKPEDEQSAGKTITNESTAPLSRPEAVLVESGQMPDRMRAVEIANHDQMQALFMTEEMLSVDRVVELCGGLPGIKSCVLAHGAAVIASHNVPESIDLVSLSAHALEMLATLRQSAARMGVGAVPAVTIHAEKGPITFFHQDDLCLLVLHKDRGFIPGVREKLQRVVEHLARSNPALTADESRSVGGSRNPST